MGVPKVRSRIDPPNLAIFKLNLELYTFISLKLCEDTPREILVESDVFQLNQMLAEGALLERVIKHFFQVKILEFILIRVNLL